MDRTHQLSITRQAQLLGISRANVYYKPVGASAEDLRQMRRIDELHLEFPFAGARMLRDLLVQEGFRIGRKHVGSLMRIMGIEAIYRRKNTSQPHPDHTVFRYLLRKLTIDRPNQVWAADISYISMARGFVYLVAIIDWHSRKVLSWRLSNTMAADFCVEALEEALAKFGTPEIFNTDRGAQFTCSEFINVLKAHEIRISMDGKGRWRDNIFVERLWRSVKYEEVYLHAMKASRQRATASLGTCSSSTHDGRTARLTGKRQIRCTSARYRSRRQPNPQNSTYRNRENCLKLWGHLSGTSGAASTQSQPQWQAYLHRCALPASLSGLLRSHTAKAALTISIHPPRSEPAVRGAVQCGRLWASAPLPGLRACLYEGDQQ